MGYLWDYVYYDDTLVMPIWEKDLGLTADPINPFQPVVISGGDYRGIYFCAVAIDSKLYVWKWDWITGLLSELVFPSSNNDMRNISVYGRPLSFVSSDGRRAFLAYDRLTSVHFAELTPTISQNLPPQYLGRIYTSGGTANEVTVGYADDATFACVVGTNMDVRIFSWDDDFPAFTVPRYKIPFQNASELTRPLIIFSRQSYGIRAESPPKLVYSNGTTKTTVEGLDLPANMKTGEFTPALGPQFCGYDAFIWNISTWNFSSSFDFRLLDWVKDETSWIYIKQAILRGIEIPPEMSVLTSGYSFKHLSPVNLGVLMTTRAQRWVSGYSGSYATLQDALIFADLALGNFHLCALTPIGVGFGSGDSNFATISPPTFHFERGCWYTLVTYQGKIALLQIIHPQFFSKYFASVPAIKTISTDEKYVTFVARTTAFYDRQHWSLAIVATQDSNLKEIVASTKERVTDWEVWETSLNGSDWYELPAGAYIEGQRWVRVKVPKSILEWKKDIFVTRNPNKVWRLVFISEPVIA